ncbi:nuclease-related domain-containing protein [Knoellia sp. p5-6-4]|uniref:nuclease-related domain-containing protein n=1 Tax=unclassified Knoellia TaxID=2618719 RepID=UPI0023DA4F2E|nr:nuclease-related domain-containing protein [Knoellia sp. p5-6-4]MDF2143830.1 nuclease-related domain-containing protein [Knoellia sp. p5-6-4]
MAVGGGSAERKAEELGASSDSAAGAWAAGAEGERRVAAELSNLREAWTVLHDRLLRPGQSEANLDHVVIGPGGMFLVDAKNRAGRVMAWEGGLFQHTVQAGDRVSLNLAAELKKVHGMAAYMAVESGRPVTPVLCLAGAHEAEFGEHQMLQGVWVVPVSKLVDWLNAQPYVLDRETAGRVVTRAMTDFPSTTTDPALLAAMGQAAARQKPVKHATRRQRRPSTPRGGAQRSFAGRLLRALVGLVMMLGSLWFLVTVMPVLLTALFTSLTEVGEPNAAPTTVAPTPLAPSAKPSSAAKAKPPTTAKASPTKAPAKAPPKPKPVVPALAPTDCARATGAEVAKVLGRRVQPVMVSSGCAWGTRLDDASTVLVGIRMSADHKRWDSQLVTSEKQRRVVYGTAYDSSFKPATALWVATGQPIATAKGHVRASADTHVVVSTTMLGLTDDQARRKALAIAAALNN